MSSSGRVMIRLPWPLRAPAGRALPPSRSWRPAGRPPPYHTGECGVDRFQDAEVFGARLFPRNVRVQRVDREEQRQAAIKERLLHAEADRSTQRRRKARPRVGEITPHGRGDRREQAVFLRLLRQERAVDGQERMLEVRERERARLRATSRVRRSPAVADAAARRMQVRIASIVLPGFMRLLPYSERSASMGYRFAALRAG